MTEPLWPAIAILAFVTLQRLVELPIAAANTKRLLAKGGREAGAGHYPLIVTVHAAWLAALWWFAFGRPINLTFLAFFVLIEFGRIWVLRTLGPRWTFRVLVPPGATAVASGPYRFYRHPNYAAVTGELLGVAFMAHSIVAGPLATIAFVLLIRRRIVVEERALGLRGMEPVR